MDQSIEVVSFLECICQDMTHIPNDSFTSLGRSANGLGDTHPANHREIIEHVAAFVVAGVEYLTQCHYRGQPRSISLAIHDILDDENVITDEPELIQNDNGVSNPSSKNERYFLYNASRQMIRHLRMAQNLENGLRKGPIIEALRIGMQILTANPKYLPALKENHLLQSHSILPRQDTPDQIETLNAELAAERARLELEFPRQSTRPTHLNAGPASPAP